MIAERRRENPKSPFGDLVRTTVLDAGGSAGANGGNTSSTSSNVFSRILDAGPEEAPGGGRCEGKVVEGVREAWLVEETLEMVELRLAEMGPLINGEGELEWVSLAAAAAAARAAGSPAAINSLTLVLT